MEDDNSAHRCQTAPNVDVLMLDEPRGHLNAHNIKWLKDCLEAFPSCIIRTSQFRPFLDRMCRLMIIFQDCKLMICKGTKGTCFTFAEKYLEKLAHFEINGECMKLTLTEPGSLDE